MSIKTHTFNGVKHDIDTDNNVGGYCDKPDLSKENPSLWIPLDEYPQQKEQRFIIHEALHACNWHASEKRVDHTSDDIAKFLWRLGYRRK